MSKTIKDLAVLAIFTLASTFLIWLPHLLSINNFWGLNFSSGFNTIYRNFDGTEYIVIAKTFYNQQAISDLTLPQSGNYFASHFPGFSILILVFAPIFGFLKSTLFVSLVFTIFSVFIFYKLIKDFNLTSKPLLLSSVFLVLPARWLIVRSVGSSEPVFIFFILLSIYFFLKFEEEKKYLSIILSGIFGMYAQVTRPPGILLFVALSFFILWRHHKDIIKNPLKSTQLLRYFPLLLIPFGLFLIFYIFKIQYGDFWAYFKSGDNIHLFLNPFPVFNLNQFWVGDIWLEDIVYLYIFGFLAAIILFQKKLYPLSFFVFIYMMAASFVAHRDISRYILPIFPFVLIAFEKILTSKEFRIVLIIIALAIYLYSQNFILANVAPIPNLSSFN